MHLATNWDRHVSLSLREERSTLRLAVATKADQLVTRQNGFEPLLAFQERPLPQVLSTSEHQIEGEI